MAIADLTNPIEDLITGNDNIVIVDNFQSIRGGRTLDVTGFTDNVIQAGHLIIKDDDEYKPTPVVDGEYVVPEGAEYAGFLIASIPTSRPLAGIMVRGTVNVKASPYPLDNILEDVKAALPLIVFTSDKA